MAHKKPLAPLIPLDDLKKVVAQIVTPQIAPDRDSPKPRRGKAKKAT